MSKKKRGRNGNREEKERNFLIFILNLIELWIG